MITSSQWSQNEVTDVRAVLPAFRENFADITFTLGATRFWGTVSDIERFISQLYRAINEFEETSNLPQIPQLEETK